MMKLRQTSFVLLAVAAMVGAAACGDNNAAPPDAHGTPDAGSHSDGSVQPDAGPDASPDAGPDAGPDAMPDAGNPTSAEIQAALDAADGTVDLPIEGVYVTYTHPAIGNDVAGFYVQAEKLGPALFVAVDPATLTPMPSVGDLVTFHVTTMATVGSLREATAVTTFSQDSTGHDVSPLVQDVSAATDLTSNIDGYASELITAAGTITGSFGSSGTGVVAAELDTAGITGDSHLTLRLPTTLRDSTDLATGCAVTLGATPFGRYNTTVELTAYAAADLTVSTCPAPKVVSAVAMNATTAVVTFDRLIAPASVMTDGSQFAVTDGATALAVTAAAVSGNTVTLTTGAQTSGTTYTVTVANTVTDTLGTGLDPAASSTTFTGFVSPATVVINELNANIAGGCDLIELRVLAGGSMEGFKLQERDTAELITFPTGFTVATNDLIVVHMGAGSATCNPNGATSETTAKDGQPAATYPQNYDTAWDMWSMDSGLTATDNVFTLYDGLGVIVDAVLASDDPTGTAATGSETQAAAVAAVNQWQMVGGGIPAGGFVDDTFSMWAAQDLNATGSDATGDTIQRSGDADHNDKSDWTQTTQSWGALNAGQTAL